MYSLTHTHSSRANNSTHQTELDEEKEENDKKRNRLKYYCSLARQPFLVLSTSILFDIFSYIIKTIKIINTTNWYSSDLMFMTFLFLLILLRAAPIVYMCVRTPIASVASCIYCSFDIPQIFWFSLIFFFCFCCFCRPFIRGLWICFKRCL